MEPILPTRSWLAALASIACSSSPRLPDRSAHASMVTLPLKLARIGDARASFAELFEAALVAGGGACTKNVDEWLWSASREAGGAALPSATGVAIAARAPSTSVLIVPGVFGDCFEAQSVPIGDGLVRRPEASLTEYYRRSQDLGLLDVRPLAVPGRASSEAKGRVVAEGIRREAARPGVERGQVGIRRMRNAV